MRVAEFDAFYTGTAVRLARAVLLSTGDRPHTEWAVARAYAEAWREWRLVRALPRPDSWVRRRALELALAPWRTMPRPWRWSRRRYSASIDLDPDMRLVLTTLDRLPTHHRRALVLAELVGLDEPGIAAELECSTGAARRWLAAGRHGVAAAVPYGSHTGEALTRAASSFRPLLPGPGTVREEGHRQARLLLGGVVGMVMSLAALSGLAAAVTYPPLPLRTGPPIGRGEPVSKLAPRPSGSSASAAPSTRSSVDNVSFRLGRSSARAEDAPRNDVGHVTGWSQQDGGTFLEVDRVRMRRGRVTNLSQDVVRVPVAPEVRVVTIGGGAGPQVYDFLRGLEAGDYRGVVFRLGYDAGDQVDEIRVAKNSSSS